MTDRPPTAVVPWAAVGTCILIVVGVTLLTVALYLALYALTAGVP